MFLWFYSLPLFSYSLLLYFDNFSCINVLIFLSAYLLCVYCRFLLVITRRLILASQVVLVVKNSPANAGNAGDTGSIPGSGRSLGGRHGNLYPMDRGAWQATVHRIAKS